MYANVDLISLLMDQYLYMPNEPSCSITPYQRSRTGRSECSCSDSTVSSSTQRPSLSPTPSSSPLFFDSTWGHQPFLHQSNVWDGRPRSGSDVGSTNVHVFDPFPQGASSLPSKPLYRNQPPVSSAPLHPEIDEDIESEVFREILSLRSAVPDDYVCHRCGKKGHWIKHCPTKNPNVERTPYQGSRPSVGYFRCVCSRQWKADAYANKPQACRSCRRPVYAYKMLPKQQ